MKKTMVAVHFNGATNYYYFLEDKESFLKRWNNHIPAVGYFKSRDENGNEIIINPSQCGGIEMVEVTA